MATKSEETLAPWWQKAATLGQLLRAHLEAIKRETAEKKAQAEAHKAEGIIASSDYERFLSRRKMIEDRAAPEAVMREARLTKQQVEEIDTSKRKMSKKEADAFANALGCPANIVYGVADIADDTAVTIETNVDKKTAGKTPPPPPPPAHKKPGPKPGTKYAKRGSKAGGRPPNSGKNQRAAAAVAKAAEKVKPPRPEILVGLSRKKAFEQLSKIFGVASQLFAYLAKGEKD